MSTATAEFRPFEPPDTEGVVAVFRSNIPKYFSPDEEPGLRDFLAKIRGEYFVAESEGEIVGAGGLALNEDETVSLCWGMVRADHLGTGLGKRLTKFRIERARELHGGRPVVICTSQHTTGFYEKLGFRLTDRTKDGFAPGIDDCRMRLG